MEFRQYDLYIDGVRLPEYFLPDEDTHMWETNNFTFNRCVERTGAVTDEIFGDVVYASDVFDPEIPGFARLGGRALSFRLEFSSRQGVGVRVCSRNGPIEWEVHGAGNERQELAHNAWREMAWGCQYVLHGDVGGSARQMTVEVRRCRVPLDELRSSLMNRTPAPRLPVRPRWSSFVRSI